MILVIILLWLCGWVFYIRSDMKKLTFVFLFILFIMLAFARSGNAGGYGLKVGVAFSSQEYDYKSGLSVDYDHHNGKEIIAYKKTSLAPKISYSIGVGYTERGISTEILITTPAAPEGLETARLGGYIKYIALPLMVNITLPSGGINPYFALGPRLMLKIGTSYDDGFALFFGDVKNIVYGGTFAVGTKFSMASSLSLFIEAAYSPDFSDAIEKETFQARNSSFAILAGLEF